MDNGSTSSTPVVFTAGSPVAVKAAFTVKPEDFSGDLFITGTGTDTQDPSHILDLNPQKATLANGIASVTMSAATAKHVDMFDTMRID